METELMYDFVLDEFMIKLSTKKRDDTVSSITIGETVAKKILENLPIVKAICNKYGKTPASKPLDNTI